MPSEVQSQGEALKHRRPTEVRFSQAGQDAGTISSDAEQGEQARRTRSKSIAKLVRRLSKHFRSMSMSYAAEEEGEGYGEEGWEWGGEDEGEGQVQVHIPIVEPEPPEVKKLKRIYAQDVGGGIGRSTLLKMDEHTLKKLIKDMVGHVERVKSENIILERTLDAMEARDREIEAGIPKFSYRYPWEKRLRKSEVEEPAKEVCSSESSSDEEETEEEEEEENLDQDAQIFHPGTDLNLEDSMFAEMGEGSKEELRAYMLSVGDVAPPNFDVMKYKYTNLIRGATAGDGGPDESALHEYVHQHKHDEHATADHRASFSAEPGKEPKPKRKSKKSRVSRKSKGVAASAVSSTDPIALARQMDLLEHGVSSAEIITSEEHKQEEEEFPDFDPMTANEVPLKYKNRFIEEQIPTMVAEWAEQRLTQTYKDSTRVMVYIDTYQTSYILTKALISDLHKLRQKSIHPLTRRMKAESLLLFMKHMKNYLLSEQTKRAMECNELRKHKRVIDTQLRQSEELGDSLHLVDFEQLRIENKQLVQDIEDHHEGIQHLKLITARCMENLKQSRGKLFRQIARNKMLEDSIRVRATLKANFERERDKRENEIWYAKQKIKFFRQRLHAFRTPNILDYIGAKAEEQILNMEMKSVQRKISSTKQARVRAKGGFGQFENNFPAPMREDMHQVNQKWLDDIKKEVKERNLMKLLGKCDDEEFAQGLLAAGSKQEPAKAVGYTGVEKKPNPSVLATTLSIKSILSIKSARKKSEDIDDAALVKSKLPIPTPGNLLMISQQQEREEAEIARISRIKSEAKAKKAKSAKSQSSKRLNVSRPSLAAAAAPRKSVSIARGRTESIYVAEPRKSVVVRTESAPVVPYTSKRRLTMAEIKTSHAAKLKDEDQLVMRRNTFAEASAH